MKRTYSQKLPGRDIDHLEDFPLSVKFLLLALLVFGLVMPFVVCWYVDGCHWVL